MRQENPKQKFVSIEGYPDQFFMLLSTVDEIPENFDTTMQERIVQKTGYDVIHGSDAKIKPDWARFHFASTNKPNYAKTIEKYGPILVREIGSYMTLSKNHVITSEILADQFPRINPTE
jgi:hypothetical protein